MSNEELVEEILIESHQYGKMHEVRSLAESYVKDGERRSNAYIKAFDVIVKPLQKEKDDTN